MSDLGFLRPSLVGLVGVLSSAAVLLGLAPVASAQTRPFPTKATYAKGYVPAAVTAAVVESSYASWKSKYLLSDCSGGGATPYYRVDNATGTKSTFSEGQGYGMVLTAYFGDKAQFDGLWAFAQKSFNANGVMGWHVTCSGATTDDGGSGSATDGDTDIAYGLLVAAQQWGGSYAAEARTYLATLKKADFTTCPSSGRNLPAAGDWQGTGACTQGSSSSYFMPGYYRLFGAVTGDSYWTKAADDVETVWGLAANAKTGIIIDTLDENGQPVGSLDSTSEQYNYDTCRTPWRDALDTLWYGTAASTSLAVKLTAWANGVGIEKIVDGYKGDGTATGQYTGMNEFVGGFAVGAMVDSQALVDSFATYFVGIANDNGTYYGASLRTLYLLQLGGFEWNPLASEAADGGADGGVAGDGGAGSGSVGTGGGSATADGGAGTAAGGTGGAVADDGGVGAAGTAEDGEGGSSSDGGCAIGADRLRNLGGSRSGQAGDAAFAGLVALVVLRGRRRASRGT